MLGLITVTMALSYSLLRSQSTALQIQANSNRRALARQAAMTGLTAGLRRMHLQAWIDDGGVESTLAGKISGDESYLVTYTTGDDSLQPGDADYAEYPYRVTLLATGYSRDPANTNIVATHQVRAVVRLLPQKLADQPASWAQLQQFDAGTPYTVYQWSDHDVPVHVPVRVEGPVHLQGPIELAEDYPPDARPFDGRIDEVAIFNRALSDEEIEGIYDNTVEDGNLALNYLLNLPISWWRLGDAPGALTVLDMLGLHPGQYFGAQPGAAGVPFYASSSAAGFDGIDDYVDLDTFNVSGSELTILAWFRADDFDHSGGRIISKATGTAEQDHYWMISTCDFGGRMMLRFRLRAGGSTKTLIANSGDLAAGQWVFAAAVYDGASMKLYKDGARVANVGKTGTLDTNSAASVYLGDNPPGSPRTRYLRHLGTMHTDGVADLRPFNGPVYTPASRGSAHSRSLLQNELKVPLVDVPEAGAAPVIHPGTVEHYRLYAGGKQYDVPVLASSLADVTLAADPRTNPLGMYRCDDRLRLGDNVTIQGTVITAGVQPDIEVGGQNVNLLPVDLPPLEGTTAPVQLPTSVVANDLKVQGAATGQLQGLVMAWDDFRVEAGTAATALDVQGRLLVGDLQFFGRTEWMLADDAWQLLHSRFVTQRSGAGSEPYFPTWLAADQGLSPNPLLTVRPKSSAVSYHFPANWEDPVYVPPPNAQGLGLKWELVRWADNP